MNRVKRFLSDVKSHMTIGEYQDIRHIYNLLIIISGAYIIYSFIFSGYDFLRNLTTIIIWFTLIIALPTPDLIKSPEPFSEEDFS